MIPWAKLTVFGDTVVTMPIATVIFAWLAIGRAGRMAFWWGMLFSLGLAMVVASKIAFIGWGVSLPGLDFTGISGHAMRAAAVFPVFAFVLLQRSSASVRRCGIAAGVAFGLLIGQSRLAIHVHSPSEVVSGLLLGSAIAFAFIWVAQRMPRPQFHRGFVAVSMCALLPTAYAEPAPTQDWITYAALYLSGHDRPYVRGDSRLARSTWVQALPGE